MLGRKDFWKAGEMEPLMNAHGTRVDDPIGRDAIGSPPPGGGSYLIHRLGAVATVHPPSGGAPFDHELGNSGVKRWSEDTRSRRESLAVFGSTVSICRSIEGWSCVSSFPFI
jgi:hypothetical protein